MGVQLVREVFTLMETRALSHHFFDLAKNYIMFMPYYQSAPIDEVASYDGLLHIFAKPFYASDFTEGVSGFFDTSSFSFAYFAEQIHEEDSNEE